MLQTLEMPAWITEILAGNGISATTSTIDPAEHERRQAERMNREPGRLEGYDCPECLNRGYISYVDDRGYLMTRDCACMETRRSIRRIERSGLKDTMKRYTFETWRTPEPWQRSAQVIAKSYAERRSGWLLAAGQSGSGKTHLCTAVCVELLRAGLPVHYMLWRDVSVIAKAAASEGPEYTAIVEPLKKIRVLYIDDLFKTKSGKEVSQADVNLAFEILNARYNDTSKLTIISTELSVDGLMNIDEAVGSRIYERSKGCVLDFTGRENWRLGK